MAEIDPYSILGVPRTASRDEIARAYRRLAKQHHPDAGVTVTTTAMARINEAWHILSDPMRRARWERLNTVIAPPHWGSAPVEVARRPRPVRQAPSSPMDSGWVAIGVLAGVAVVVAVLMIGVSLAARPADNRARFADEQISFVHPPDWNVAAGDGSDLAGHRVLAHLVTFSIATRDYCTNFASPCAVTGENIPPGEASILITAWQGGTPPVPDPVTSRPFGLDADAIIGGEPAAFEIREERRDSITYWWQLSPPGFPDRWIEVSAEVNGLELDREAVLEDLSAVMNSIEFTD
ncbi:MAG: molecular chaperone DnaJ [Chloroflexota bacterium]|nr:molecular chaperone DnaJ [Chloroflexota bacterium]